MAWSCSRTILADGVDVCLNQFFSSFIPFSGQWGPLGIQVAEIWGCVMRVYLCIFVVALLCLGGVSWAEDGVGGQGSFKADEKSRIAQLEDRVQQLEEQLE